MDSVIGTDESASSELARPMAMSWVEGEEDMVPGALEFARGEGGGEAAAGKSAILGHRGSFLVA
jgi:hypothetical protein